MPNIRAIFTLCVFLLVLSVPVVSAANDKPDSTVCITTNNGEYTVAVYNPLNWTRTDIAEIDSPFLKEDVSAVIVTDGKSDYPAQLIGDKILFTARDVPALSYKIFRLKKSDNPNESTIKAGKDFMENEYFRVQVDLARGTIKSIYDKANKREITPKCREIGALQIIFRDKTKNLDIADESEVLEAGPVRTMARFEHSYGSSSFVQDVVLYEGLPRIDINFTSDWQETASDPTALKMSFHTDFINPKVAFDEPSEAVAQRWIDLSEGTYGISILNYCESICSVNDNIISVLLPTGAIRRQIYETTISIYPHSGDCYKADTPHRASELSTPLSARFVTMPKWNSAETDSKNVGAG